MKAKLSIPIVVAALTVATSTWAQRADRDRALSHFEAARVHIKAGRCDLAIEELRSSIDFEPGSVGARLNLGDCYVKLGRLPEAFRQYKEAEALASRSHDAREGEARRAGADVESKLVRIVLRDEEPPTPGLALSVDGAAAGGRPWTIAVTPNVEHVLTATAPDGRRWTASTTGKAGDVVRLNIELRAPEGHEAPAPATEAAPAERGWRTAGLVTGGIGAAGVITGAVFGALAMTWRAELADAVKADARCSGSYPGTCDPAARSALQPIEDRAFLGSTVSTIAFIAGTPLLVAGIVLFVAAPSGRAERRASANLRLRFGAARAAFEGSF